MDTARLRGVIDAELAELVAFRHDLHRNPELSYREERTASRVCAELDRLGIAHKPGIAKTGVVAHLPATEGGAGEAVALRADMDALPLSEKTGRAYASETPGVMHACGHDGHTTILLGAARTLAALDHRPNPVTFLFQPAEEGGAGGMRMCDEGCLLGEEGGGVGTRVGRVFGLHGWPEIEVGKVATKPGPLLAATDDFILKIRGTGGHAAYPHMGTDPVVAAANVVGAVQTIASRNVSPADSLVITFGKIAGGTANNIIPTEVECVGTVRTLKPETRRLAKERFYRVVEQTAAAHGCSAEIVWHEGYPVTHNDPEATERFFDVARDGLGAERVGTVEHASMGGEDFSYYGRHVPACFFLLGLLAPGDDPATTPKLHQPEFDFNDEAIPTGVEMMCRLAMS